jgi:hypothetical protein
LLMAGIFQMVLFPSQAISQTAFKEFCDSVPLGKNMTVTITSKKSNLVIMRWDKSLVWVKVSMSFRNADPSIARKELEYARFNCISTASGVNINNFFTLPPDAIRINSIISIDYIIYIPDRVTLVVNNEYGSCRISNLNAFINLNNKYGDIYLERIRGQMRIYATLCDIRVNGLNGNAEFNASNSNFFLKNINGNITVANKVGTMHFEPGPDLNYLKVTSSHSEISLKVNDINRFNYDLSAKNAVIDLGDNFRRFPFNQKSKERVIYHSGENNHAIEILTSYNSIKLH